ncbi:nuclear transcription factor y subunit c-4 [Moniliophthora roreri]|uniref:Putative histone-fold-containing protein n=1 Tax=Moniliophthora roreri TaxID=221103 RepID=A0A0W0G456_MONRR|nr:nuclear transcription factor y subunit c-4 [Moniliophthora roreri]
MSSSSSQPFVLPGQPLNEFLRTFWQRQIAMAEEETPDYRHPTLPLARIKKVMKSDPDVKQPMVWLLANVLRSRNNDDVELAQLQFYSAKHAKVSRHTSLRDVRSNERALYIVFIAEITARAFIIADSNKRRTLSRSDIAQALSKSDQFDFLIDIVPREDASQAGMRKPEGTKDQHLSLSMDNLTNAGEETPNPTEIDQFESLLQPTNH